MKACPYSSAHLVASFSNPNHAGHGVGSVTEGEAWKAHMPRPVPKGRLSNESVETRPALCPRFRAVRLQVAVTDGGKGTTTVVW